MFPWRVSLCERTATCRRSATRQNEDLWFLLGNQVPKHARPAGSISAARQPCIRAPRGRSRTSPNRSSRATRRPADWPGDPAGCRSCRPALRASPRTTSVPPVRLATACGCPFKATTPAQAGAVICEQGSQSSKAASWQTRFRSTIASGHIRPAAGCRCLTACTMDAVLPAGRRAPARPSRRRSSYAWSGSPNNSNCYRRAPLRNTCGV